MNFKANSIQDAFKTALQSIWIGASKKYKGGKSVHTTNSSYEGR